MPFKSIFPDTYTGAAWERLDLQGRIESFFRERSQASSYSRPSAASLSTLHP
jgi:hypothetical protein